VARFWRATRAIWRFSRSAPAAASAQCRQTKCAMQTEPRLCFLSVDKTSVSFWMKECAYTYRDRVHNAGRQGAQCSECKHRRLTLGQTKSARALFWLATRLLTLCFVKPEHCQSGPYMCTAVRYIAYHKLDPGPTATYLTPTCPHPPRYLCCQQLKLLLL
jgi:hypothetical protein